MIRRKFLMFIAGIGLANTALANNSADTIPGFDEALKMGGPVMIHVTAPWCPECRKQKPIVARLLATPEFSAMKKFDVDFDSQKAVLRRYKVQSQSTIIVYKGGKEVDRLTGDTDPAVIEALMRKAL